MEPLNKPILVWKLPKKLHVNSADPDQTPQKTASDQGLLCLQIINNQAILLYEYQNHIAWHT